MNPLISIIIPTYNRAHLIDDTLQSVLAQSYTHWECIVIDDGSSDQTAQIVNAYCNNDNRFQYHQRPKNRPKGANACRNYGFTLSKGDYINWFDSDDIMLPQKLEIQIEELHNSSYDFTICQTMLFDVVKQVEMGLRAPKLKSDNIFEDYIAYKIFWLTGAPLWKRQFLEAKALIFDETLQQAQDYDFHMRALYISQNYNASQEPLVVFNVHDENMSRTIYNHPSKLFSNIKVKYNILKKYPNLLSDEVKHNVLGELVRLYSYAIRESYKKIALRTCFFILKLYKSHKDVFVFNKLKSLIYIITPLFYVFFGKGHKLTKRLNKIIS